MKRFLLFCYSDYYPEGGWNDLTGSFDTVDEAIGNSTCENAHIIDTETMKIIRKLYVDFIYVEGKHKSKTTIYDGEGNLLSEAINQID